MVLDKAWKRLSVGKNVSVPGAKFVEQWGAFEDFQITGTGLSRGGVRLLGEMVLEQPFLVCEALRLSQPPLPKISIIARMVLGLAREEEWLLLVGSLLVLLLLVEIFVEEAPGEKIVFGLKQEPVFPVKK